MNSNKTEDENFIKMVLHLFLSMSTVEFSVSAFFIFMTIFTSPKGILIHIKLYHSAVKRSSINIGSFTANNDDSTYAISDKVYDRAQPINLDSKGVAFEAPDTPPMNLSYSHLNELFEKAFEEFPISAENSQKLQHLDLWVIDKLRVAFGNRILKQMNLFVPVYVACGGEELEGIDYVLATKIFRKFEALNLAMLRDELKELCVYLQKLFGKNSMKESVAYLERLQKLY